MIAKRMCHTLANCGGHDFSDYMFLVSLHMPTAHDGCPPKHVRVPSCAGCALRLGTPHIRTAALMTPRPCARLPDVGLI
jgi:hypothetical protein